MSRNVHEITTPNRLLYTRCQVLQTAEHSAQLAQLILHAFLKLLTFCLLLLLSVSVLSAPEIKQNKILSSVDALKTLNAQLLVTEDEKTITQLLKSKTNILENLTNHIKQAVQSQLPATLSSKEFTLLESRIKLNTKRGNPLAAQRDQVKLEEYKTDLALRKYLEYLIKSSKNYLSIETIVQHSQKLLDNSLITEDKLQLPEVVSTGTIFLELEENYQRFTYVIDSYQDIIKYIIDNPRTIASVHWAHELSLLSAIAYVNHFDIIQSINYKLAPLKIDVGGVVLSVVIIFLVYFSYPFIFKFTNWFIEKYVIEEGSEHQELIHHEIRKPARALLIFFGINLGTYAFFYKTDYRSSLEGFSFIVYSILFVWLIFRIIDSLVLSQIQKLSNSNIELRKELFNLGVQSTKAFIVIIFLTFGLSHFGISLTAIMSTLGVGGLAFALAAKDTLSNLFGGMTILFDNVFKMGDWIEVGEVEGTVAEIGLRSTTIRTFENALITVPNSLISVTSVMNWDRRAIGRRIKMYIGVTYDSNMDDIRQGIEDLRTMLQEHPDIANPKQKQQNWRAGFKFISREDSHGIKSTQLVYLDRYNDFSIDILLYCFAKTVNWAEWLSVKENVLYKIAAILEKNNLEFAYPTEVTIHRSEKQELNNPEKTQ